MWRIRVVKGRYGDGDVKNNEQEALEVVTLLILEEPSDGQDGKDQHDEVEDVEVEIHGLVQSPADNNGQGSVEEGSLKSGAEDVR